MRFFTAASIISLALAAPIPQSGSTAQAVSAPTVPQGTTGSQAASSIPASSTPQGASGPQSPAVSQTPAGSQGASSPQSPAGSQGASPSQPAPPSPPQASSPAAGHSDQPSAQVVNQWAIIDYTRVCDTGNTVCTVRFQVDEQDGSYDATQTPWCLVTLQGSGGALPLTKQAADGCPEYKIASQWDPKGFTVLSVVNSE